MIGSFGGEDGECFLVFGRVEFHLNRSMKMKAKMVKTMGCNNKGVTLFGSKNCKKCDIFFSLLWESICSSTWGSLLMFLNFPLLYIGYSDFSTPSSSMCMTMTMNVN